MDEAAIKEAYGNLMGGGLRSPTMADQQRQIAKISGVSDKFPYHKDLDNHATFLYVGQAAGAKEKSMKLRANMLEFQPGVKVHGRQLPEPCLKSLNKLHMTSSSFGESLFSEGALQSPEKRAATKSIEKRASSTKKDLSLTYQMRSGLQ